MKVGEGVTDPAISKFLMINYQEMGRLLTWEGLSGTETVTKQYLRVWTIALLIYSPKDGFLPRNLLNQRLTGEVLCFSKSSKLLNINPQSLQENFIVAAGGVDGVSRLIFSSDASSHFIIEAFVRTGWFSVTFRPFGSRIWTFLKKGIAIKVRILARLRILWNSEQWSKDKFWF